MNTQTPGWGTDPWFEGGADSWAQGVMYETRPQEVWEDRHKRERERVIAENNHSPENPEVRKIGEVRKIQDAVVGIGMLRGISLLSAN